MLMGRFGELEFFLIVMCDVLLGKGSWWEEGGLMI